eukprot:Selendium_serpulae@DN6033_c0_g1_i1.p1
MELLLTVSAMPDRREFGNTDHISPVHLGAADKIQDDGGILCQFNWREEQRSFRLQMNGSCRKFRLPYEIEQDSSKVAIDFYDTSNRFAVPLKNSGAPNGEMWFTLGETQGNIGVRLEYAAPTIREDPFPAMGDGSAYQDLAFEHDFIVKQKEHSEERIVYETIVKNAEIEHKEAIPDHVVPPLMESGGQFDKMGVDGGSIASPTPMHEVWEAAQVNARPPPEGVAAHCKVVIQATDGDETMDAVRRAGWDSMAELTQDFQSCVKECTGYDASVSQVHPTE